MTEEQATRAAQLIADRKSLTDAMRKPFCKESLGDFGTIETNGFWRRGSGVHGSLERKMWRALVTGRDLAEQTMRRAAEEYMADTAVELKGLGVEDA